MKSNFDYWLIMFYLAMLQGFLILVGCILSPPGSTFLGEGWEILGAGLLGGGCIVTVFIAFADFDEV